MKLTKYSQLKHGMRVKCEINGVKIEDAKLSIDQYGCVYICQNKEDDADTTNMLGYKYSWFLGFGDRNIEHWSRVVTNLRTVAKRGRPKKKTTEPKPHYIHTHTETKTIKTLDDGKYKIKIIISKNKIKLLNINEELEFVFENRPTKKTLDKWEAVLRLMLEAVKEARRI